MRLDFNDVDSGPPVKAHYVPTDVAQQAVEGHEAEIVEGLGIHLNGHKHIHCPYPDHPDKNPSWRLMESGSAICSAGCVSGGRAHSVFDVAMHLKGIDFEAAKIRVIETIGREDLIVEPGKAQTAGAKKKKKRESMEPAAGCSLAAYAKAKGLPIERLASWGLGNYQNILRIPYYDASGAAVSVRLRVALEGKDKQRWREGDKALLYGINHLAAAGSLPAITIVEGETDCFTLWCAGFPAVGTPGAANWNEERDARLFDSIPIIYVVIEPDDGGKATLGWLARSRIRERARTIRLIGFKDPNALFLDDPGRFAERWQEALANAGPPPSEEIDRRSELEKLIDEFNAQYAVVNEAGKALVYEQQKDTIIGRNVLIRITFPDFKRLYQNRLITVKTENGSITKSAAEWWLNSPQRRQYLKGVIFDPTGKAPTTYWNLWTGFSVEPRLGDWSLMRNHILKVMAAGDNAHDKYIMGWLALMFQKPEIACEVALVFRGEEGIGKGILCNWIVRAWGQHGIRISHAKHLTGSFNAHLRDCVMLFADEAFFAGDRQHEGILKGLITDPTLEIEGKYQNLIAIINMLHIMMASNSDWVVPVSLKGRRFAIFDPADNKIGDRKYFLDIVKQMENGGMAAMIWDFLH